MQCERDWFEVYGSRALDHFGRITEPRVLTQDNAWRKTYHNYNHDTHEWQHCVRNYLTDEERPITREQFYNDNIITDDGRLNI